MPQRCQSCRDPARGEDNRRRWGCGDKPATGWNRLVHCPICSRHGADPDCGICDGAGGLTLRQCPWAHVPPRVWKMVESIDLVDVGILPIGGGYLEQACTFIEAAAICSHVRKQIEDQRDP